MPLVLAILAALVAAPVEVGTDAVDPVRLEAGLRARTGDELDAWRVVVTPTATPGTVQVAVAGPDGLSRGRTIALQGQTVEDRSRELAASVALLMDQPPDPRPSQPELPPDQQLPGPELPPEQPEAPPSSSRPALRGWLGLGPRVEVGTSLRYEAGLDLLGGLWLARERVQPLFSVGFSGGARSGISVLHARFGAGAAFGAPLGARQRIWLGGHVLGHAMYLHAAEASTDSTWLSSTEVGGLLQYRGRRLFLGLRTGVDLTLPSALVHGTRDDVRRGNVRWCFGLMFGLVFG
ncbi:hypothetical protein [Nannocystis radixulma]|uniref:Uncharacterized protein n=1 Tax=Nannocystis radixulma TaxID=2995305 RepID=A0ABT5B0U3_9BACT|nr:hypothetical protein [Nannocystis radixulma]MDC0667719.1 hypothetical protein [Nannocystis radixulma]